ncbi:MAG TPA: glucokinase [Candidatus Angelobacter sp.]|nr:glucokinase [Candidatus Angelobacter sp.]
MILAGDIGGTNARLAAFETEGSRLQCVVEKIYPSREHNGLPEIVADFVKTEGIPAQSACFGVAGPVRGGRSKISNLPWVIDSRELAAQLRLRTVGLINDLEALAYGIDALDAKDFVTISEGSNDAEGNMAVISAGSGLGEAGLYWDGFRHHPFACEGGHTEFAPKNQLEIELLQYLMKKFGNQHVSYERILSGPGVQNIYEFLRDTSKEEEPAWLKEQLAAAADAPALISQLALSKKAPICDRTLSIFVSVFGSEAGNCALKFMGIGGIFVAGIAGKIVAKMKEPAFMESFLDKGRMKPLLEAIPIKIILNDDSGLLGAARFTLVHKAFMSRT